MGHSAEVIAAFLGGEPRLIGAAWRDDPERPTFLLPEGGAGEHRALAKAELRCIVRDCPQPDLTTVGPRSKRHHFRHTSVGAGGHSPESLNHIQGKAVVAQWLRELYPTSAVVIEQGLDTQRTRIADVMLTSVTGQRVAFEIQYASLTPQEWWERTEDYARQGVPVVWLWGHRGVHMKASRARGKEGQTRLNPTHLALVANRRPVLWLNPELRMIATPVHPGTERPPSGGDGAHFELAFAELQSFMVNAGGISSQWLAMLHQNREAWEAEVELERIAEVAMEAAAAILAAERTPHERWLAAAKLRNTTGQVPARDPDEPKDGPRWTFSTQSFHMRDRMLRDAAKRRRSKRS